MPEGQDEYDVAVVVYCRARGADESDAQSRAERTLLDSLLSIAGDIGLPANLNGMDVAGLSGLSHAHVTLSPNATPFKRAGMGPPKLAQRGPWPCTVQPELMHELTPCDGEHAPVPIGTSITRAGMTRKPGT